MAADGAWREGGWGSFRGYAPSTDKIEATLQAGVLAFMCSYSMRLCDMAVSVVQGREDPHGGLPRQEGGGDHIGQGDPVGRGQHPLHHAAAARARCSVGVTLHCE